MDKLCNQFFQWSQFLLVDQSKLFGEVNEVFETGVQMCLHIQRHDASEVRVVDVGIDSEEPFEDTSDDLSESWRKCLAQFCWEQARIVHLHKQTEEWVWGLAERRGWTGPVLRPNRRVFPCTEERTVEPVYCT